MTPDILDHLICPATGAALTVEGDCLRSDDGSIRYPVFDGIPCLISGNLAPTHAGYSRLLSENDRQRQERGLISKQAIEAYLAAMLVSTNGNLYRGAKLTRYPIPQFFAQLDGREMILDIGCNWGRWSLAAALAGHRVVGVDVHLEALRVAKAIADELDITPRPQFILADARSLPFARSSFDGIFSYSVLQHFSKGNCEIALREAGRVLRDGGISLIQMPNNRGIRSWWHLAKRSFTEGRDFDVRYYSISELLGLFENTIGPSSWSVDCFFGLNVQSCDKDMMRFPAKCVAQAAQTLKAIAGRVPLLGRAADSVFVQSCKGSTNIPMSTRQNR